jgi:hypothetical protein
MSKSSRKAPKKLPALRVFILGAGVSAACGIPVAKDIFRATMLQEQRGLDSAKTEVHKLLRYLYPGFDQALKNYPNIEDFLNLLEMAKAFNSEEFVRSEPFSGKRIKEVERTVLRSLTAFLWNAMQSKDALKPIRRFAEKEVRLGDVAITFNWDIGFEQALYMDRKEPSFHYSYSRDLDQKQVFLLKPHGSIDWFKKKDLPNSGEGHDYLTLDKKLAIFKHFDFSDNPELKALLPVIVPPVSSKEFRYRALKRTWASIFRAVSQATDLHIIGYSLPREDQFARFVLRRAIRNNLLNVEKGKKAQLKVRIVNPDETVWTTFSRLIGGTDSSVEMEFKQTLFEDYVSGVIG